MCKFLVDIHPICGHRLTDIYLKKCVHAEPPEAYPDGCELTEKEPDGYYRQVDIYAIEKPCIHGLDLDKQRIGFVVLDILIHSDLVPLDDADPNNAIVDVSLHLVAESLKYLYLSPSRLHPLFCNRTLSYQTWPASSWPGVILDSCPRSKISIPRVKSPWH
jgi:hypothetical protein